MRWLLAALVGVQAAACNPARRDDLAACKEAEALLIGDSTQAARVIETCTRAHLSSRSADALIIATRTHLLEGHYDTVVATAATATGDPAPRLWHLAGDAELGRGHAREARDWYERALTAQRGRDPLRAANIAARIADLERSGGGLGEAIRFQHDAQVLAAAGGDAELSALMTLALAQMLLEAGDVRAANTALASMTEQVRPSATFYREYLATAGELDAAAGRPATAAASFLLCVRDLPPLQNPHTQWRCHTGLAALYLADGGRNDEIALRHLGLAGAFLDATARDYGDDPDRAADIAWMRALIDRRSGDAARADAALRSLHDLAAQSLGAGTASRVSFTIGRALADTGNAGEAERWFVRASDAVEKLRDGAHYREIRRSLPRELRAPAEALFALRARAGDGAGALAAMERALTRDFVDQLAASVTDDGTEARDAQMAGAERRVRALQALDARPDAPFDPARHTGAPIIGFFAAEDALWRVRVAGGRAPVEVVRIGALAELAPMVKAVRGDPAAPAARTLRARLLPDDVLPPAEQPVVIVPDPFLEGVRFAALGGGGHYLIERNPIALAPTFAIAAGAAPAPSGPLGPAVVLGDPDPTHPLPEARREAADVAAVLGVVPILGPAADHAAVAAARRAKVLHVASHGSTRDDGTIISLGDGDFGTADVLELGLAPELVVVASCTSAATRPDAMWTSISAAFLVNGAGAVVGATASIPDDVARDIVIELHRHAVEVGPVLGLARALRSAIARGTPVRSWSAFAVLGRPSRPVVNP